MVDLATSVLVVDDEVLIAEHFASEMEAIGLTVCGIATTGCNALALACEHRPAVVLMDVRLQGAMDGVDAAIAIHNSVGSKVIFITGSREPANLERIKGAHPTAVLIKPIYGRQLQAVVESALSLPIR
jgi:CheY-like chemotaxis protein